MHSTLFRYTCLLCLSALTLGLAPRACADPATLTKIDPATLTVTQYAPDGTVVGKVTELTDGDEGTRWIFRTTQTPAQYLPLRLQLDMGTAHTVGKVRIANYFTGANFIRGFKTVDLFVGDALAPATGGTPDAADVQVTISDAKGPAWTDVALAKPATGRYVTVRVKANWGGNTYAANEIELYADAGKASTTTPGGGNATTGKAPGTPTTTGNPTTGNPTGGTPATGKTTGTPTGTPATGNVTTGNPGAVNPATANPGTPAATAGTRTYTIYDYSEQPLQ